MLCDFFAVLNDVLKVTSHCFFVWFPHLCSHIGKKKAKAVAVLMTDKMLWKKLLCVYSYLR